MDVAMPKRKTKGILSCQQLHTISTQTWTRAKEILTSAALQSRRAVVHQKLRSLGRPPPLGKCYCLEHAHRAIEDRSLVDERSIDLVWILLPAHHNHLQQ